ncbi:MAG: TfoX/Sxy family protein [Alphaproteobacteria bacterium]
MPQKTKFVERVLALLAPHGDIRARAMFGGYGLYLDGLMFALIAKDRLYFKTDAETRVRFERVGGKPFSFMRGAKEMVTSYYEAPPRSTLHARAIMPWLELGVIAARGAQKTKQAKAKRANSQSAKAARRPATRVVKSRP